MEGEVDGTLMKKKQLVGVSKMVEEQCSLEKREVVITQETQQGLMDKKEVVEVNEMMEERQSLEKEEVVMTRGEQVMQEEVFEVNGMVTTGQLSVAMTHKVEQGLIEKKQVVEVNEMMEERRSQGKEEVVMTRVEHVVQEKGFKVKGMVTGQLSVAMTHEAEQVRWSSLEEEDVLAITRRILRDQWHIENKAKVSDKSKDNFNGKIWETRESCEAQVEYEMAVRKFLSHTTHCSKCDVPRPGRFTIILLIQLFIASVVTYGGHLLSRIWFVLEQSYFGVIIMKAYKSVASILIRIIGLMSIYITKIVHMLSVRDVTVKLCIFVTQILNRKLLLFGVISVLLCLITGARFMVNHPDSHIEGLQGTGIITWINYVVELVKKMLIERLYFNADISVLFFVFICVCIAITIIRKPGPSTGLLNQIYESVVTRSFLFGGISVLLCLISGARFMVNHSESHIIADITTKANIFLEQIYGHVGINIEPVFKYMRVSVVGVQWKDIITWINYAVKLVQKGLIERIYFNADTSVLFFVFICVCIAIKKLPWTKIQYWLRQLVSIEEILKSIVYGGLTEIIASISIVAFFADFDTTILNVIAFALAGLIGGCFFIITNIWELKKRGGDTYREQLGRVNFFPFHATLAMLSFIIFGMIPPSTFVFSFLKTNDKKIVIWVVSAASLLCLSLLAIFKAYVTSITCRFKYVRTVLWYHLIAMGVSICSYLASKMVKGSIEDLGLFDTSACDALSRHN